MGKSFLPTSNLADEYFFCRFFVGFQKRPIEPCTALELYDDADDIPGGRGA